MPSVAGRESEDVAGTVSVERANGTGGMLGNRAGRVMSVCVSGVDLPVGHLGPQVRMAF